MQVNAPITFEPIEINAPMSFGITGKSAYQSYVDTTDDDPVLTEEEWAAASGHDPVTVSGDGIAITGQALSLSIGTGATQVARGNHTHGQLHDRSHAITSTGDHTAGNWKVFHSNGSGQVIELPLGADGTYLKSNGASAAPSFATPDGGASITGTGLAYVRSGGNDTTGTIGDPSKPYATAQAAWDDGATRFHLGAGSWVIDAVFPAFSAPTPIWVEGVGAQSILALTWRGEDGSESAGVTPPELILYSDKSAQIGLTIAGGNAAAASDSYAGGNLPNYGLYNCRIDTLTLTPGNGCNGGANGSQASSANAEFTSIITGTIAADAVHRHVVLEGDTFYPASSIPDGDYTDIEVTGGGLNWGIKDRAVGFAKLPAATAKGKILARKSEGVGDFEQCDLSDILDFAVTVRDSDFSNSTGVSTAVSDMSFPIAANEKVLAVWEGIKVGSAAGAGIRAQITGPASPTFVRFSLEHYSSTTAYRTIAAATAFATDVVEVSGTTDELPFRMRAYIVNGANAGTVQLCIGSESGALGVTVTRGMSQIILDRS